MAGLFNGTLTIRHLTSWGHRCAPAPGRSGEAAACSGYATQHMRQPTHCLSQMLYTTNTKLKPTEHLHAKLQPKSGYMPTQTLMRWARMRRSTTADTRRWLRLRHSTASMSSCQPGLSRVKHGLACPPNIGKVGREPGWPQSLLRYNDWQNDPIQRLRRNL
jgi:hypothetical protein